MSRCSIWCSASLRRKRYDSSCEAICRGTAPNWLRATSLHDTGPRAGIRCDPHWKISPRFQTTNNVSAAQIPAHAARWFRIRAAIQWIASESPSTKNTVSDTKNRFPYDEIPAQSGYDAMK